MDKKRLEEIIKVSDTLMSEESVITEIIIMANADVEAYKEDRIGHLVENYLVIDELVKKVERAELDAIADNNKLEAAINSGRELAIENGELQKKLEKAELDAEHYEKGMKIIEGAAIKDSNQLEKVNYLLKLTEETANGKTKQVLRFCEKIHDQEDEIKELQAAYAEACRQRQKLEDQMEENDANARMYSRKCHDVEKDNTKLRLEMEDESPGTMRGRLVRVIEFAEEQGLCCGLEARAGEGFLLEDYLKIKEENKRLNDHIIRAKSDHKAQDEELTSAIFRLSAELEKYKKNREEEITAFNGEISFLREQLEESEKTIDALKDDLCASGNGQMAMDRIRLTGEVEELKNDVNRWRGKLLHSHHVMCNFHERMLGECNCISVMKGTCKDLREKNAQLNELNEELIARIEGLAGGGI